jgi:branched-chain amino acid transport system substrate-binding protein
MKYSKLGALAAGALLVFSACSGSTATTAPAASTGASSAPVASTGASTGASTAPGSAAAAEPAVCQNKKGSSSSTIDIYSSEPLEGTSLAQTSTMVAEIKAVLDGQKVGNFTIKFISLDDASAANKGDWDGTVEQSNATTAINDPDAMAYIGTYNSGAAKLSIPILNGACLAMFSPANSYPGLTKAVSGVTTPGEPNSYYPNTYRNYARDINTDDVQGGASSEWAYSLGFKTAYVIDDGQTYGQGIGRAWAQHFGKIGGKVVSANGTTEDYDPSATDYQALAQKIKASGADVVFVGAITGQGTAKLWKDIRSVNPKIAMFGPDGVNEKSWFTGAGSAAVGTYLTFGGVDVSQLTGTGKTWATAYEAANNGTQPPFYAAYGHAAGQIVLNALTVAGTNDRYPIMQAMMATANLDTVIGSFTLDPNGDPKGGVISSYIMGSTWPPAYKGVITQAQP